MLISWRACSRACALTDKLGLVKTYQGCLQGKYAELHIIVTLWLVPYNIKPTYL